MTLLPLRLLADHKPGWSLYRARLLKSFCLLLTTIVSQVPAINAADERVEFNRDIRPILSENCFSCHGPDEKARQAGLRLDIADAARLKLDSGKIAIVPGKTVESELIQRIATADPNLKMPPADSGKQISSAQVELLNRWITQGAEYQRHWSFVPLTRPRLGVERIVGALGPIDSFVRNRLKHDGLAPSPPVDRERLIRRVTLDLTGTPPTLGEIDDFLADQSPDAYERVVDRLLTSPRYGERLTLDWLDAARFADTHGFNNDTTRSMWRWRDWTINAFNSGMPFDQFVTEQLAGDLLPNPTLDQQIATGFNRNHVINSEGGIIPEEYRVEYVADRVHTTATVFLGLSMGCVRCHDHKFEPLSQRDYYGFQAFFTPAKFNREKSIATPSRREAYAVAMREYNSHPKLLELIAVEAVARQKVFDKKVAQLPAEAQAAHRTPPDQRTAEQSNLVLETEAKVKVSDKEITAALTSEEKKQQADIRNEVEKLPKPPALPAAMAMESVRGSKAKTFLLNRGDYNQPGDEVTPGFPQVLTAQLRPGSQVPKTDSLHVSDSSTDVTDASAWKMNRANLADWIASPVNPLTARVMVNRIWQHHFGQALVLTSSDFGTHGQAASHPLLLDWLASDFITRGWDIRRMHRRILSSATYCQGSTLERNSPANDANHSNPSSEGNNPFAVWTKASQLDPDNRLYWRMNRIRLEGEVIRDSLLAISGQLNSSMNGPGVSPPIPKELFAGAQGWSVSESKSQHFRRSIYIFARRNLRFPFLEVFDAPDNNLSCAMRERSTTAPQSLTLLNSNEVTAAAKVTASRIKYESPSTEQQIESAYRLALGRTPTDSERIMVEKFLINSPLDEFCRALFNLNEFVYVE